jgi:hypothetical protein
MDDEECRNRLLTYLPDVADRYTAHYGFETHACKVATVATDASEVTGTACECVRNQTGQTVTLGPSGSGCSVQGRASDCLYDSAQFEGCTAGVAESCAEACWQATLRIRVDEIEQDYEIRRAACVEGACESVVRISDECFTGVTLGRATGTYDCSLSDDAILELQKQAVAAEADVPSCSDDPDAALCADDTQPTYSRATPTNGKACSSTRPCRLRAESKAQSAAWPELV